ncbi:MAG: hydantoinase/oxoprolinase family protein [Pseudomonadota bacterium]
MTDPGSPRLAIDIGGTFTDTVLIDDRQTLLASAKTPTTPEAPARGAVAGARLCLAEAGLAPGRLAGLIHGTTLATNALIERRGARVATVTTAGFRDILEIAYERRYSQYAIDLVKPEPLAPRSRAFTITGRMDARGRELTPLGLDEIAPLIEALRAARVEAVAICLLHAYANPAHEQLLYEKLAAALPELAISLSHQVSPEAREYDRLCTTLANAYIQPLMAGYLTDFERQMRAEGVACPILMMTAGGGMTTVETARRLPIRLVESGPAGGAILAARIAEEVGAGAVLSFDMGGTTAKLCLIDGYRPQTARSFEIDRAARFIKGSGLPVRIPVIEMIEIGAGGGSIARVDGMGRIEIGPDSAGADPGPAAFAKGGTRPTVTDAVVDLGLIDPDRFAEGRLRIDRQAASAALRKDVADPLGISVPQAAFAISEIVDEKMAAAGRMHAVESGKDIASRVMIAFGGNGPLHATRVARRARVRRILIPGDPGVGSALGFLFAPVSFEIIRSRYARLETLDVAGVNGLLEEMSAEATALVRLGAPDAPLEECRVAYMRYHGQGHEIEIALPSHPLSAEDIPQLTAVFEAEYRRQFSRTVPGMAIEVLNWGLSVSSQAAEILPVPPVAGTARPDPLSQRQILCDLRGQPCEAAVFDRTTLRPGDQIDGPALIVEAQTTTLVSVDFVARIDGAGLIWLTQKEEDPQ